MVLFYACLYHCESYLLFNMPTFRKPLSSFLCCFGLHAEDEEELPATLTTLQNPTSVLSISIPHNTVPHSSSESTRDDTRALRKIFSSSSSIRGYQTAATTPGLHPERGSSLDVDFRFGSNSPPKHPSSRFERLGNHIKQKLSAGRLRRTSSERDVAPQEVGYHRINYSSSAKNDRRELLGVSQRSTGLTELLASRTASEGGYDSDALSMKTPVLNSNTGTIRFSPHSVKQALQNMDSTQNDPLTQKTGNEHLTTDRNIADPMASHVRAQSSPLPSTPSKVSFLAAVQASKEDSPTETLHRLSKGIADGTIKPPETPELRAVRVPNVSEIQNNWCVLPPRRASSLRNKEETASKTSGGSENRRTYAEAAYQTGANDFVDMSSLIPDLDAVSAECAIHHSKKSQSTGDVTGRMSETTTHNSNAGNAGDQCDVSYPNTLSQTEGCISQSDFGTASDPEEGSIHLFNMRISQRLASNSMLPVSSSSDSNNATTQSLNIDSIASGNMHGQASVPRCPSWIAVESNRRPSDPDTRRLFESLNEVTGLSRLRWSDSISIRSVEECTNGDNEKRSSTNKGSSIYPSDGGIPESDIADTRQVSRCTSLKNPNSIAVGGRSVSAGLPSRKVTLGIGQIATTGGNSWLAQPLQGYRNSSEGSWKLSSTIWQKHRSVSLPRSASETHRRHRIIRDTDADEVLSVISAQDLEDKRNERLSDFEDTCVDYTRWKDTKAPLIDQHRADKINHESQIVTSDVYHRVPHADNRDHGPLSDHTPTCNTSKPTFRNSDRGFRAEVCDKSKAFLDETLHIPHVTRGSTRKANRCSVSDSGSPFKTRNHGGHLRGPRRSVSLEENARGLRPGDTDQQQHLSAQRSLPLFTSTKPRIIITDADQEHIKSKSLRERLSKKSVLSLRHWWTVTSDYDESQKVTSGNASLVGNSESWSKFPSHTRAERNGSATAKDRVKTQDFYSERERGHFVSPRLCSSTPLNRSTATLGFYGPAGWKTLNSTLHRQLDKFKSKSMTLRNEGNMGLSLAERAKGKRKGLSGKWRRLYRKSSYDLRRYAFVYGHRSSVSVGDEAEHPELECLPSEGRFKVTECQRRLSEVDGSMEVSAPRLRKGMVTASARTKAIQPQRSVEIRDTVVGDAKFMQTLPALHSESDIASMGWRDSLFTSQALADGEEGTKIIETDSLSTRTRTSSNGQHNATDNCKELSPNKIEEVHTISDIGIRMPGAFD